MKFNLKAQWHVLAPVFSKYAALLQRWCYCGYIACIQTLWKGSVWSGTAVFWHWTLDYIFIKYYCLSVTSKKHLACTVNRLAINATVRFLTKTQRLLTGLCGSSWVSSMFTSLKRNSTSLAHARKSHHCESRSRVVHWATTRNGSVLGDPAWVMVKNYTIHYEAMEW